MQIQEQKNSVGIRHKQQKAQYTLGHFFRFANPTTIITSGIIYQNTGDANDQSISDRKYRHSCIDINSPLTHFQ